MSSLKCEQFASTPSYVQCTAASGETIGFNCPVGVPMHLPVREFLVREPEAYMCGSWARSEISVADQIMQFALSNREWLVPSVAFCLGLLIACALIKSGKRGFGSHGQT
jgi:hypothetical protein